MASIEETGKNIEEATHKALEQMGVTEDEVDVEILEEGAKGFLGIGQALARVRVTLREARRPETRARPSRRPRPKPAREREEEPSMPAPPPEPKREVPPKREAPPKREPPPRREAPPKKETPPAPAAPPAEVVPTTEEAAPVVTPEMTAQAAEIGREVLQKILDALENGGTAEVKTASEGQIALDIVGGDAPRLIGRHGQTINALQYLVGIVTNRRVRGRLRTVVDAEGYRARREDALRKQALYLAKQVKENGQEAVLDDLDANERRIIHTTLADDPDVSTYSEGEEPERHLVISPKK